ncbi:Crp/Fnr family transcriptional regulator [Vallitalea okinawensis]|uniref:Crp/Fnr family transcriptional regulator n=1 Tax=Vallitalea okinawensis TaxID=2078660 RepID=UPI000CFBA2ED|nr:Crp/Fnr family transcriptional regulator [Vallitalea okinawensis]
MKKVKNTKTVKNYLEIYSLNTIFKESTLDHFEIHCFKKDEFICRLEEPIIYFYFLVKGKAKVSILLNNGKSLLLRFYFPLNVMGDIEFLSPSPYSANVEALTDCHCLAIPMDYLRKHYEDNIDFVKFLNKSLGEKLFTLSYYSSSNLLYPVKNRIASYIAAHREESSKEVILPSSYSNIAEMLGTTYRHLSRTLKEMCDEGILAKSRNKIIILNEDKLKSLVNSSYKD